MIINKFKIKDKLEKLTYLKKRFYLPVFAIWQFLSAKALDLYEALNQLQNRQSLDKYLSRVRHCLQLNFSGVYELVSK